MPLTHTAKNLSFLKSVGGGGGDILSRNRNIIKLVHQEDRPSP